MQLQLEFWGAVWGFRFEALSARFILDIQKFVSGAVLDIGEIGKVIEERLIFHFIIIFIKILSAKLIEYNKII